MTYDTATKTHEQSRRHHWPLVATAGIAVVALLAAAFVFQPWRLFIDNVVDEALPGQNSTGISSDPDAVIVGSTAPGEFVDKDHPATGTARIVTLDDGTRVLRLEDFATDNGPDLFVYLSPADASATGSALAEGAVNLGPLKGNIGNQNYALPDDIDVGRFASIVIWCRQFSSAFGAAPIAV